MKFLIMILFPIFLYSADIDDETEETFTPDKEKLISDAKVKIEITRLANEANANIKAKKYKEAESILKQIKELSDVSIDYHYLKAVLHYSLGELNHSLHFLYAGIKLNNSHDPSYFLMGMIYGKKNDWEKAVPFFEKANQHGSYNPYYRMNLAVAYYQIDNFEKAALEAKNTFELKENYSSAKILYIRSLVKTNKKEAYNYLLSLIEKKIDITPFYSSYIQLLFEYKRNYAEIIKELAKKQTLSLDEKKYLAYSYFKDGEIQKSYSMYKQFIGSERDTEEDLMNYLRVLVASNKESEADKILSELKKSNFEIRKYYNDFYISLIQKKEILKLLYQPVIMR
jgi:tetratricopeptide (TPR) repeat protein